MEPQTSLSQKSASSPKVKEDFAYALIRLAGRSGLTEPNIVSVGINGKPFNMQRGMMIPVPQSVVGVLSNAVVPEYAEEEDGITRRRQFLGMRQRYPFEVVRKLDKTRYDALRSIALERTIIDEDLSQLGI